MKQITNEQIMQAIESVKKLDFKTLNGYTWDKGFQCSMGCYSLEHLVSIGKLAPEVLDLTEEQQELLTEEVGKLFVLWIEEVTPTAIEEAKTDEDYEGMSEDELLTAVSEELREAFIYDAFAPLILEQVSLMLYGERGMEYGECRGLRYLEF